MGLIVPAFSLPIEYEKSKKHPKNLEVCFISIVTCYFWTWTFGVNKYFQICAYRVFTQAFTELKHFQKFDHICINLTSNKNGI